VTEITTTGCKLAGSCYCSCEQCKKAKWKGEHCGKHSTSCHMDCAGYG
jgi:hypothetical protein